MLVCVSEGIFSGQQSGAVCDQSGIVLRVRHGDAVGALRGVVGLLRDDGARLRRCQEQ